MSDESFHLTPLDIRRYDFGAKSFRGYDEKKVEDFRNQVAEELERLTRLNQELDSKARGFHEQLRAFRERDKALNEALVSAQQLRSEIREQAEREAQLILREARAEGERQLDADPQARSASSRPTSRRSRSRAAPSSAQLRVAGRAPARRACSARKAHRAGCPRLHRRRRPATSRRRTTVRT